MVANGLAYVGLGVADVDAWTKFARDALGLMPDTHGGIRRLRMDQRTWRIAVHESPADDILYAGFEVADAAALGGLRELLDSQGIVHADMPASDCAARQVDAGIRLHDPDGLQLEFVHGATDAATVFTSALTSGFLTGDQGLGHIVIGTSDLDRDISFYRQLGFAVSDFITAPVGPDVTLRIVFMHCNPRHHTLAMARLPGGKRLNHLMVEVTEVDDVIRGHARCMAQGYNTGGIGRHPNDRMLSFYVTTPAGFDVEYGWGGRRVEGAWTVQEYDKISLWGHERTA